MEGDEGSKTIHMRQDPTTLAHRRHRGEDGDRARSRDHLREGLRQDEARQQGAQEEEARQQGDEEAPATVLEAVTAGAGVAHGVNPELGVDMAAGDEMQMRLNEVELWVHDLMAVWAGKGRAGHGQGQ